MRITDKFVFFFSWKDMFSNHYRCQHRFADVCHKQQGVSFATVEHFMMYQKAQLFNDCDAAREIANTYSPQSAKMIGRRVKNFDNGVWESWREGIVQSALVEKMATNPDIADEAIRLYNLGLKFVEASPYDRIWGIGIGEDDRRVEDPANWQGKNLLGKCWEGAIEIVIAGRRKGVC